jgi:hypothetical protein
MVTYMSTILTLFPLLQSGPPSCISHSGSFLRSLHLSGNYVVLVGVALALKIIASDLILKRSYELKLVATKRSVQKRKYP